MMADQRNNEVRWYSDRQALKQVHAKRASASAHAQSILSSLNSSFDAEVSAPSDSQAGSDAELKAFDLKLHAAQQSMEAAMTLELKRLGVPFFGTDPRLVVPDGGNAFNEQPPQSHPKWSPIVSESELLALKRRMISHLEDLYRE